MAVPSQPVMTGDNDYIMQNARFLRESVEAHVDSLRGDLAHVVEQTSLGGAIYGAAGEACRQTAEAIVANDMKVLERVMDRADAQFAFAEHSQEQEEAAEAAIRAVSNEIASQS